MRDIFGDSKPRARKIFLDCLLLSKWVRPPARDRAICYLKLNVLRGINAPTFRIAQGEM
jgi:hypothetical protein